MNGRQIQGIFLIGGGFCMLIGLFATQIFLFYIIALIGTGLFILGIPGVNSVQPGGRSGFLGIILLELAAFIVLAYQLGFISDNTLGNGLIFASALAGLAGRLIVGWITTRKKIFPAWVGWVFIFEGFLNFVGGGFNLGSLTGLFYIVVVLLGAAALFGFGFSIVRKAAG